MKAIVKIEKSFDEVNKFTKEYERGDFAEFFDAEGKYLDDLAAIAAEKGESGDSFTVTYTITVKK